MAKAQENTIKEWKAKHGQVFEYEVDGHYGYFRKPSRQELSMILKIGQKDPMKLNDSLIQTCLLAGDEELMNDDSYYLGLMEHLQALIEIKSGELKKL